MMTMAVGQKWGVRCVRWPNGVSVIVSPTAIFIVAWGNAPGHWFHSVAFWPTAIVKRHPSQTHGDVQVADTGDAAALAAAFLRFSPKGWQKIAGGKPSAATGTSPHAHQP